MSRSKEINPEATFQSPRAAAAITGLSLGFIRKGCQDGIIPHIKVGTDYRINMPLFIKQMNQASSCQEAE